MYLFVEMIKSYVSYTVYKTKVLVMKKLSILSLFVFILTIVPFALAREGFIVKETVVSSAAQTNTALSADQVATLFPTALSTQDSPALKTMLRENVRFGSYYGAWWDGWEDVTTDEMLANIWQYDALGQLNTETLPNEPVWFLQNLNPYTDLLPNETIASVLLVNNFSENSDAELLVWISADAKVSAMVVSATGFQRVSR